MVSVVVKLNFWGYVNYFETDLKDNYEEFLSKIKMICSGRVDDKKYSFNIKYYDIENDPCVISNRLELSEAISVMLNNNWEYLRIYVNLVSKIKNISIFDNKILIEKKRNYAKRYKKRYYFKNHVYEKYLSWKLYDCSVCKLALPVLNNGILKCENCKDKIHKKCLQILDESCKNFKNTTTSCAKYINQYSSDDNITYKSDKFENYSSKNEGSKDYLHKVVGKAINLSNNGSSNGANYDTDSTLNEYSLVKVIGRGSYSKVFLARSKFNHKFYAIKAIKKSIQLEEDMSWVDTEKHILLLARNCPFLVSMHCSFQNESRLFFVLEFIAGGDMMYFMQKIKKLTEDDAKFYTAEILVALDFLHQNNIIYRDLKLDNILITISGHIKLTDYGLCKKLDYKTQRTSTFCGTPHYIAPEMLTQEDYGLSVDWWSYGVVLYEMIVGKNPFDIMVNSENINANPEDYVYQQIMETTIRYPRSLSIKATSLLKQLLAKDPNKRIGVEPHSSVEDIKTSSFFKSIDWQKVPKLEMIPPKIHSLVEGKLFKNPLQSMWNKATDRDVKKMVQNFDSLFVEQTPTLTPEESDVVDRIFQDQFKDFDTNYLN